MRRTSRAATGYAGLFETYQVSQEEGWESISRVGEHELEDIQWRRAYLTNMPVAPVEGSR